MRRLLLCLTLALAGCGGEPPAGSGAGLDVAQALGGDADVTGYARALQPRDFVFPQDHGAHPDYRNEWWYFTGHLQSPEQRRFGFQLTLFRVALAPPPQRHQRTSNWAADQVYMGHFALSDIDASDEPRFHAHERFARAALGLAGAENPPLKVWLEDWRVERDASGQWRIHAAQAGLSLDLDLQPISGILLQGDRGLSQKSAEPGNASYYYSIPRMQASGRLQIDGRSFEVSGESWLDREWSTSALGPQQSGWDWFSLQLADGAVLMYYQLRRRDGSVDPHSAGVYKAADAAPLRLRSTDVELEVTDTWQSPRGGRYPAGWRLRSPLLPDDLSIRPLLADQELDHSVRYWEGAVAVTGASGEALGRGYVELTGYAR